MKCQKRAVVNVALMVVLGLVLLVGTGVMSGGKFLNLFHSSDSKQKKELVTLTADVQKANDAAKAAQAAQAQADANQKALDAAKEAKDAQIHEYVHGTSLALAKEPTPSIYVQVASILNTNADNAFSPLQADKTAEIVALVNQLTSADKAQVVVANQQLQTLNAQLAQEQAKEAQLSAQQQLLVQQKTQAEALAGTLQVQTQKDSSALQKWASDTDSLAQRFHSFVVWTIVFSSLYLVVYWVLPVVAKAFPAVAPLAHAAVAVMGWPLHALHAAEVQVIAAAHTETQAVLANVQTKLVAEQAAHASTTATLVAVATGTPAVVAVPSTQLTKAS